MTARIDHYAKMLGALELAEHTTLADVSRNAALLAQVHATAYAAEQARIGNLIAMFALPEADAHDFARTGFSYAEAAIDIRKALGLS
jgi:hypothetical protein